MIPAKKFKQDVMVVVDSYNLNKVQAIKLLIYTATELVAQQYKVESTEAAEMLSKAALTFRDEIARVERMMANKG